MKINKCLKELQIMINEQLFFKKVEDNLITSTIKEKIFLILFLIFDR